MNRKFNAVPVRDDDPNNGRDEEEDEDEDKNAVAEGDGFATSDAQLAGDEPVHIEEDRDEDEEGNREVHNLFGEMPKKG